MGMGVLGEPEMIDFPESVPVDFPEADPLQRQQSPDEILAEQEQLLSNEEQV